MSSTRTPLSGRLRAIAGDLDGVVRHVVWKGAAALRRGDVSGDVDVFVHPADVASFARVLGAHGFVPASEGVHHRDPHLLSLLGVDPHGGALVHVDASTAFVVRRPPWPTRVLPVAEFMVARGRLDPALGLVVSTPADECALRLVEWACVPAVAGPSRRRGRWRRAEGALEGTTHDEVVQAMNDVLGAAAARAARSVLQQPGAASRRALRAAVEPRMQGSGVGAGRRRLARAAMARFGTPATSTGRVRRQLPGGGRIVAVIGADGAGKSTLVAMTARSLASKVAVTTAYFGSGDGPAAWYRVPLRWARRVADERIHDGSTARSAAPVAPLAPGWTVEDVGRLLWACTLALEKNQKARRAARARSHGYLVLCDRYPQVQFPGGNDGPLLTAWGEHGSRLIRRLVRWERDQYDRAVRVQPDLVLHLAVDLDTAVARRPDHDPDDLRARIDRVARLDFEAPIRQVDATGSPRQVRTTVLRELLGSEGCP